MCTSSQKGGANAKVPLWTICWSFLSQSIVSCTISMVLVERNVPGHSSSCRSCLMCATYGGAGKRLKPPLIPIPVGGLFHHVGVDIMELPLTTDGRNNVVVIVDYLTKWVEAFPVADQTSETIAALLVDEIICCHEYQRHYCLTVALIFCII